MHLGGWQSEKMVLRYAHVNVGHLATSIAALPWERSRKQSPLRDVTNLVPRTIDQCRLI
jgi:hypothetical protein